MADFISPSSAPSELPTPVSITPEEPSTSGSTAASEEPVATHRNIVRIIGHYGGDETHAISAWTSTSSAPLTDARRERIPKLLKMLADNHHGTPFEKSYLHFTIHTELPTHYQCLKHRVGVSINAESARYQEIRHDDYYVPHDWPPEWKERMVKHADESLALYHEALKALTPSLGRKRAKESARFFRPMSGQLTSDISFNFRSFVHFYRLRSAPDAQLEVADLANEMLTQIKAIPGNPFQHSLAAFGL